MTLNFGSSGFHPQTLKVFLLLLLMMMMTFHFVGATCFHDLLSSLQKEDLESVCALVSSSSHGVLASLSGSDKLVEFLLMDLYSPYSRGIPCYLYSTELNLI